MKDSLIKLVDEHNIISFDIFDTLLFRNVYEPIDIFRLVQKKLKIDDIDFCDIRVSSESESRTNVEAGECNYDEIYEVIEKKIGKKNALLAKNLELDLELDFIDVNPFMKEIFDYCLKKKKKVFLISDMYLSSEFIYKMLEKCGYKKVPLYVSCEYRCGKGTGKLFHVVCDENNLDKNSWLHIGDNIHGDYERPIEFGIDAYNYKNIREYDKSYIPKSIEESIITAIQNNYLYNGNEVDYWKKFGSLYISPIYFGFTFWLYKLTKELDNLFFLARDGYIIKKIYELFPKTQNYIKYIYCSRKSLQIPSLLNQGNDNIVNMLTIKNGLVKSSITLDKFLKGAQLDNLDKYKDIIRQFGFNDFDDVINDNNYIKAKKLVAFLVDDIKEKLVSQNNLAIDYLNQEGMDKFDKINIVDIGWAGSIQYSINKLLNKDSVGYYFGTTYSQDKDNLFSSTFGWLFDLDVEVSDKEDIISNVMMYELIFSAPHGTTLGYKKGKTIEPIICDDDNSKIIDEFQNSALNIIKKYLKYYDYFETINPQFCLGRYRQFIKNKEYNDMVMFSHLSNDFVLGSNERYSYVQSFSKSEVNNLRKFNRKRNKSIWVGTYVFSDLNDDNELYSVLKKIKKFDKRKNSIKKIGRVILPFNLRKKLINLYRKNY